MDPGPEDSGVPRNPAAPSLWKKLLSAPFVVQAVFLGLIGAVLMFLIILVELASIRALDPTTGGALGLFCALYLVGAILVLGQKRWAFGYSLITALVLVLLYGPFIADVIASPGYPGPFPTSWAAFILLVFVIVMSLLALVFSKNEGWKTRPFLSTANSKGGVLAGVFVGIVLGGLIVGLLAGGTISRILTTQPDDLGDVTVAYGSANPQNSRFFAPQTINVTLQNATITWVNGDNQGHTVTADDGSYDKSLVVGGEWTHTYTKTGTYNYHCTPHPWMKGTVIVRP